MTTKRTFWILSAVFTLTQFVGLNAFSSGNDDVVKLHVMTILKGSSGAPRYALCATINDGFFGDVRCSQQFSDRENLERARLLERKFGAGEILNLSFQRGAIKAGFDVGALGSLMVCRQPGPSANQIEQKQAQLRALQQEIAILSSCAASPNSPSGATAPIGKK